MVMPNATARLDRGQWAAAALDAIAAEGLAAVSVEPLAARLGATKGSFYWHFANRDALIDAALQLWEQRGTAAVIAELDGLTEPADRLRRLFDLVFRTDGAGRVDLALLAHADEARVAAVLARVTRTRLAYLAATLAAMGHAREEARRRALLSYSAYVGLLHTRRAAGGEVFTSTEERERYLGFLMRHLV